MAIRIQNLPEKSYNEGNPTFSMPNFNVNYPPLWVLNEHQIPLSLSSNVSYKAESQPQKENRKPKSLGFQIVEQESSSTQSISHSQSGGSNSQDQSILSESGQDESCGRSVEGRMKPVLLYRNNTSEVKLNPSYSDLTHQMVHVPYPPTDPYFAGLMTAYGQQAIPQMGSQAVGMPPARVPLPLNLPEDGPIYVNAKQYHGILRRRQLRAKLEAQNKLIKTRKPYLHESRHLHALNRFRGSGGRFLSTKNLHQDNSLEELSGQTSHRVRGNERFAPTATCSEMTSITNCDTFFHNPDRVILEFPAQSGCDNVPCWILWCLHSSSVR